MQKVIEYLYSENIININEKNILLEYINIIPVEYIYKYIIEKGYLNENLLLKKLKEFNNKEINFIIPEYLKSKIEIVPHIFEEYNIKNNEYNILVVKVNKDFLISLQKDINSQDKIEEIKNIVKNNSGYFLLTFNPSYVLQNDLINFINKKINVKLVLNIIDINSYKNILYNYFYNKYKIKLFKQLEKINIKKKDFIITEKNMKEFIDVLLNYAIYDKANYIHIEDNDLFLSIKIRKNGIIKYIAVLKKQYLQYFKKIFEEKLDEIKKEKITFFSKNFKNNIFLIKNELFGNVKFSIINIENSNNISLKIEQEYNEIIAFNTLNYSEKDIENFSKIIKIKEGIIIITGKKNQGRKLLFNAFINKIASPFNKIIVNESSLKIKNLLIQKLPIDFKRLSKIDYDVLGYGEARTKEEIEEIFNLSAKGNLIYFILNFNNILNTLIFLTENYKTNKLINNIRAIIAQQTVRKLCPNCKKEINEFEIEQKDIYIEYGLTGIEKLWEHNENGCPECNFTGYSGILPLTEIIIFDKNIQIAIEKEKENINNIISTLEGHGFKNFQTKVKELIIAGITDVHELNRLIGYDITEEEFNY